MPTVSRRLADLTQSQIRAMTRECERVGGINLGQGLCDLPTPPLVRDGAIAAIHERKSTYSFAEGVLDLRKKIAEKFVRDNGLHPNPQGEVVVTIGATGAFAATLLALLNPGDGILLMEPYYGYHLGSAKLAGLKPQFLTLTPPDFTLTKALLEASITPETKAVVVCTPSNPSGKMFSEAELRVLAEVARAHDLLVITDEIYEYITYDGRTHISPAGIDGLWERTVTIGGLSKTFSITGWRLGWAVAPEHLARWITLANDLFYVCAPTPLQHGAAAGFDAPKAFFDDLKHTYTVLRDRFCNALVKAGLEPIVPQGAYYVLADVSRLGLPTSREAAMHILHTAGVAGVAGSAFYQSPVGERLVRFCYAKEDPVLDEAIRRLGRLG